MNELQSQAWERYTRLMEERPELFRQNPMLRIETNKEVVDRYVEANNRTVGVVYESRFNLLIVDLVYQETKENPKYFCYERVIPREVGGIVAVPLYQGKLILLRQYRHALRDYQLAFPRGFGEPGVSAEENLAKELSEELGTTDISEAERIGMITPDSGLTSGQIAVFRCNVNSYSKVEKGYEEIEGIELVTPQELDQLIAEGKINDGFTLGAYEFYLKDNTIVFDQSDKAGKTPYQKNYETKVKEDGLNTYLFELDSVRKTPVEIRAGQKAMLDELVLYGNNIVLTMNQLTDSMAFLDAVKDPDKYPVLLKLIELHKIKANRYIQPGRNGSREIRFQSPSHYLQHSLEKVMHALENLDEQGLNYHFSSTFLRENDPVLIYTAYAALRYANTNIIDSEIECIQYKGVSGNVRMVSLEAVEGEKGRDDRRDGVRTRKLERYVDYSNWEAMRDYYDSIRANYPSLDDEVSDLRNLKKYITIILELSREDMNDLPVREDIQDEYRLLGIIQRVLDLYPDDISETNNIPEVFSREDYKYLLQARGEIRTVIENTLPGERGKLFARSVWYQWIGQQYAQAEKEGSAHQNKEEQIRVLEMIQLIIDVCYNFTCEYSISNADSVLIDNIKRTEDGDDRFREVFEEQLAKYLTIASIPGQHDFQWQNDSKEIAVVELDEKEHRREIKRWHIAVQILAMNDEIIRKMRKRAERKESTANLKREYIQLQSERRANWKKITSKGLRQDYRNAFIYFIVFVISNVITNELQSIFESGTNMLKTGYTGTIKVVISLILSLVTMLLFGLLSGVVSEKFDLHDITDSVKSIITGIKKKRFLRNYQNSR